MRYAFIQAHRFAHAIRTICRVLRVHHSGYYAWLKEPTSARARENLGIVSQIKEAWIASGTIYSYRKVYDDLQDLGVACGEQRVYRLMKAEDLRSQTGYKRKPRHHAGQPHVLPPITWLSSLMCWSPMRPGSRILRTFARMKVGCI